MVVVVSAVLWLDVLFVDDRNSVVGDGEVAADEVTGTLLVGSKDVTGIAVSWEDPEGVDSEGLPDTVDAVEAVASVRRAVDKIEADVEIGSGVDSVVGSKGDVDGVGTTAVVVFMREVPMLTIIFRSNIVRVA